MANSSSQPLVYDPNTTYTASQGDQSYYPSTHNQITSQQRNAKIAEFVAALPDLLKVQELLLPPKEEGIIRIYYFIGRLNPPHNGHIETLKQLIQSAIEENPNNSKYKIIILLGSGPKKGNRLDNPLSFETKKDFITFKLKQLFPDNPPNFIFDTNVKIVEMANAPQQITKTTLPLVSNLIEEINMYRFSGAKDGDDEKLNWIETTIRKILSEYAPILTTSVVPVIPITNEDSGEAMSATDVRIDIFKGYQEKDPFKHLNKYVSKGLYDTLYGERIFAEIASIASAVGDKAVNDYISKKGGSKRRPTKKRLTKRRNPRRRKSRRRRLTKRRKSKRQIR